MHITVTNSDSRRPMEQVEAIRADPGFAMHPTDHMVSARWSGDEWADFAVEPYGQLSLDPRAMAIHYGQAIFEGMKAFAMDDGTIAVFRPEMNAERFALSAQRMAMPPLPIDAFVECCDELIRADQHWVPDASGTSLYLRPFMFATEAHIGIRASIEYRFMVVALPAAPFFSSDFSAISVAVFDDFVRAADGGTGEAKCAGNYAASLLPRRKANEIGCAEVLWLDAKEHSRIEELSGMNVCFVERGNNRMDTLITPRLAGTILRGVTRDSLLQLATTLGHGVEERDITIDEVSTRAASGEISEAFALGTAAVIAPIGKVVRPGVDEIVFGSGIPGVTTTKLCRELLSVQQGRSELFPEWRHVVEGASVRSADNV